MQKFILYQSLLVIGAVLFTVSGFSQGTQKAVPVPNGAGYGYYEYLPQDYASNPTKKFPTIIFLHGVGEKGDGSTKLSLVLRNGPPKLINQNKWPVRSPATGQYPAEDFIVISPQNYNGWFNADALHKFVEDMIAKYRIDPDRVYFSGLSAGAISIYNYLVKYNDQPAAIGLIAGNGNSPVNTSDECLWTIIPFWAFHGDADTQVNVGGDIAPVGAMNKCNPPPNPRAKITIYNGVGHDSWTRTYDLSGMSKFDPNYDPYDISIYDWFLQFKRGALPSPLPSANAGSDITLYLPTNSTNITGSGNPGSGSISSYAWSKVSGPAGETMSNATSPTVSISNLVAGIYTFRLTITNSSGQSASDDVKVSILNVNQAPTANAGPDLNITLPTNTVTINGSGSDTDGAITSYAWTKVSGPASTISGQTTATLAISNMVVGTYVYSLTVTDNSGATATDNVTIIVNPALVNQKPTANAGADKTINLPTNSTNLTGSGSDPDGAIASYFWEKVSGPTATLANTSNTTLSISNLVAGIYIFRITVTDDKGATASDDATVTVISANLPPTANAGADISITLPLNTTTLSGSGSDNDGSIASYSWTQVSGPNTSVITNATNPVATISNLVQGTYVFRLTVTDDKGSTAFDNVNAVVNALPVNVSPTANAGADKSLTLPTNSISLSGSGSDTDGTITTYQWIKVSGPTATLATQTTPTLTLSTLLEGSYTFRLTVTDNQGATGSDDVIVTVQPALVNQAPTANAGTDQVLTLPTNSTTISGSGTDADGTIASYNWTKISGPSGSVLGGATTSNLSVSSLVAGSYVFRLVVTDNLGATGTDEVTVIVNANNAAPSANAGSDITLQLPINSTLINGSGEDTDGTITSYNWTQVSGPSTATLGNENTVTLTASDLIEGTYRFRLTVTDDDGDTGADEVKVVVNSANQAPTANAGLDKTITLPTNTVNLVGIGTDPDGTISTYLWTQISGPSSVLSADNTSTVTVSLTTAGIYKFRLNVTDNGGSSDFDDVTVTVNDAIINQPPAANAGSNQTITLPVNSVTLLGSGSDVDGAIVTYLWTKESGPTSTLANDNTATLSVSNMLEGTYVFRLTVTDDKGASATDDVTVTVVPAIVNQIPNANAGTNKTLTLPTNSTSLFGSGSDADGSIVSYLWSLEFGPAATMANENTPTLTLSALVEGVYTFRLTVTDNAGASNFDDVLVTVNNSLVNQAPIANAGPDKTIILPTNSFTLNGSGSDADGSIASYLWIKVSGPTVVLSQPTSPNVNLSGLIEGIYTFRLEVSDNNGASDTDDVKVTVLPAITNQPPSVNCGTDKTIFLPINSIVITANVTDQDGTVTTLLWAQVSGPTPATLVNQTLSVLTANDLVEGTYKFRLTATDDKGATAFDEILITVNNIGANIPPTANAGPDITIKLPTNNVNITGIGTDSDGTISSFQWAKISGPALTISGQNTANLILTNMSEGQYQFSFTVTDDDGDISADLVNISVLSASINTPPVANAGSNQTIELPINTVILNGIATDSDGTVASVLWTQTSGANVILTGETTNNLIVSELTEGSFSFQFEVTDDGGLTSIDNVTVTVVSRPTIPPPNVFAGEDQSLQLPITSTSLTAVVYSGGIIESYKWTQVSGTLVSIDPDSTAAVTIENLTPGTYVFKVTVTDEADQQASDEVTVEVSEPIVKPFNTFSPDKLGPVETETWYIANSDLLDQCQIAVYSRQGVKVYESTGYPLQWDGTYNGKLLPEGVYFYTIKCTDQTQTGSVTIIR